MRPNERRDSGQQDLLRSRLDQIVDPRHPLVKLSHGVDWQFLEQRFGASYTDRPGRPPLPTRLMAGLAILKHTYDLSDEVLCERWLENPYYQLFCGEEFFRHTLPFDRSSLTRWRQRMGEEKLTALLQESLSPGHPQRRGEAGGLHPYYCRHHRTAQGDRLPHRCQAAAPCARTTECGGRGASPACARQSDRARPCNAYSTEQRRAP